jgi:hypothetical protein
MMKHIRKRIAIIAIVIMLIGIAPTVTIQAEGEPTYTEHEIVMLAQMVWGEARGCTADEQRLVVWTAFQRVDADGFGGTVEAVLTAYGAFAGYRDSNPVDDDIRALCAEEAAKWARGEEPPTMEPYAPTKPYHYFDGDGRHNWFREGWKK